VRPSKRDLFAALTALFSHPRNALLLLLEHIPLSSTSQDQSLEKAIAFILAHQNVRSDWISVGDQGSIRADDWSFISEQWWPLVADTGNRTVLPTRLHHRYLKLCVISQVANELKSGDLCSPLGRQVSRLPPTTDSLGPIRARGFRIRRADRDSH
jgi:hypothetical protein